MIRLLVVRARLRRARSLVCRRQVTGPRWVRAALCPKPGRPTWGATGPDRFDCSGLVQWAYQQTGVPLHRTTYDQIHDGIAVPRSQIQPGDPCSHTGHVQMAIGNGMVVEAPLRGRQRAHQPTG